MPNIKELAEKALQKQKKPFVKGIRPDQIARLGSIEAAKAETASSQTLPANSLTESTVVAEAKLATNRQQSDNKPGSNGNLNGEHSVSNALANREHSVSNALANREHSVSSKATDSVSKTDSVSNASPKALAKALANREHSVSNTLAENDFESLVGKEKLLLIYVFKKCQLLGALETPLITTEELKQLLDISSERLRNIIYRLSKKGVLSVIDIKNGRSGWRKFCLKRELFQKLSFDHSVSNALANREHSVSNASPKAYAEPLADPSSSSSFLISDPKKEKTTTTETQPTKAQLPDEWDQVDYSSLHELGIFFGKEHVTQIYQRKKMTAGQLQDSINYFAFDVSVNKIVIKTNGVNLLMGVLNKGPWPAPSNYESPEDGAMRAYVEAQKKLIEKRQRTREEFLKVHFDDWRTDASKHTQSSVKEKLEPWTEMFAWEHPGLDQVLRNYWIEHVWPTDPNNPDSPKDPVDAVLFSDDPRQPLVDPVLGDLTGKSQEEITRLVREHCDRQFGPIADEQN